MRALFSRKAVLTVSWSCMQALLSRQALEHSSSGMQAVVKQTSLANTVTVLHAGIVEQGSPGNTVTKLCE